MPSPFSQGIVQRWVRAVRHANQQIYVSSTRDPYLNLSIEDFLLRNSRPESAILFLYVNTPCIVIGRNQNPWLEVNLNLLKQHNHPDKVGQSFRELHLVRRRSGGGTVFHDEGNLNYSVICPSGIFTRNKHAEMVAKAIGKFNKTAHVNERHDIVIDSLPTRSAHDGSTPQTRKISGSAYKLIRNRALHHGTLLLTSPNLLNISKYLSSPARSFLTARGVESVRSPVANVFPGQQDSPEQSMVSVQEAIILAFKDLYKIDTENCAMQLPKLALESKGSEITSSGQWAAGIISNDLGSYEEISSGVAELQSNKWIYEQTPQSTLASHPETSNHDPDKLSLPDYFPKMARVHLKIERGRITESDIDLGPDVDSHKGGSYTKQNSSRSATSRSQQLNDIVKDKMIYEVDDFQELRLLTRSKTLDNAADRSDNIDQDSRGIMQWLNKMFGKAVSSKVG